MAGRTYRDAAVVLRTSNLGEADRIIVLLGREHGKIRAVARGVRKTSSKFGAKLEPFAVVDAQFHIGKSLDTVTQAEMVAHFGDLIATDYDRYEAANLIAEIADRLSDADPSTAQFKLLVGALRSLAIGERDYTLVADAYVLRALTIAGWQPAIVNCAVCSDQPVVAFSPQTGGGVCARHAGPGAAGFDTQLQNYMGALLSGNWDVVEGMDDSSRSRVSGLIMAFAQYQLERSIRTLHHGSK